ncbi:hypothetical protein B0H13DRAFT_1865664 [Mycena leptocephala]|nr:hypothetical protein B0H13DRAFT_1865664 [Mycena leptocephala]
MSLVSLYFAKINMQLAAQFLERNSRARAFGKQIGFGQRIAQDIGAHWHKTRGKPLRPEDELEKQAYWLMVLLDAQCSGGLGRSMAIQSDDFDLELLIQWDDQYWESSPGNLAFHKPPNTPSLLDFFNVLDEPEQNPHWVGRRNLAREDSD